MNKQLTRSTWEHWVAISEWVGQQAFALRIQDRSLPKPFYFNALIVIDPDRDTIDGYFVLALHRNKPILCQVVTHGLYRYFRLLNVDKVYPELMRKAPKMSNPVALLFSGPQLISKVLFYEYATPPCSPSTSFESCHGEGH